MEELLRKNPKLSEAMKTLLDKNVSLTTTEKRNRLYFAFANRKTDWNSVIFSDEIQFGKVVVWASINHDGPWKLRFFNGRFKGQEYVSILDEYVLPYFHRHHDMILMHDWAPAHKSALVKSWQQNHPEIRISDFRKKSWDMNPMNKVWMVMKERLESYASRNVNDMQEEVVEAWRLMKNDPDYFVDLYSGMERVMEETINCHGSFLNQIFN